MTDHQRLYKKNMTVVRMLIRIGKVGRSYSRYGLEFEAQKAEWHRGICTLKGSIPLVPVDEINFQSPQGVRFFT